MAESRPAISRRAGLVRFIAVLLVTVSVATVSGTVWQSDSVANTLSPAGTAITLSSTPVPDFTAIACRLTGDLNTMQKDHIQPLARMLGDWVAHLGQRIPPDQTQAALRHATAAAQIIAKDASTVRSLRSASNPRLVVDITKAFEGYAAGLSTLAPVLEDHRHVFQFSAIATAEARMNAGKTALADADNELGLIVPAGAICR